MRALLNSIMYHLFTKYCFVNSEFLKDKEGSTMSGTKSSVASFGHLLYWLLEGRHWYKSDSISDTLLDFSERIS